ncbi:DNA/RNA-binding protein KIN17-like [Paramacrobiotus metropolitanus]|uniref:DNA/RNA-binding protein KIN17-like n=1 Tax=Paramacrobiotus metropolitanus TaxID=2943436 RepID=UPI002445F048|nr:DNA/RNA-binding protein KIN17-like [Paramacrobiotus metropolitanus]
MGKHEPFSPKAIANRIKSKGLQKLRWYCQMCQKQCRDANGFKCHVTSEAHQRQLLLFGESPTQFLGGFSADFEKGYMDILKRRFGTRRVNANQVYQEYIKDKDHIHMNSTKWMTLTGFVMYLGRSGKCAVDETEKGWFIKYIERDPEEVRRQEALRRRERTELDDEERLQKNVADMVEKDKGEQDEEDEPQFTELQRDGEEKIVFSLVPTAVKKEDPEPSTSSGDRDTAQVNNERETKPPLFKVPLKINALQLAARATAASRDRSVAKSTASSSGDKKRKSALEEIMEEEKRRKEKQHKSGRGKNDFWLHKDIVVKITTPRLGEQFHKRKGVVKEMLDKYTAVLELLDSGVKVKVDQVHVETVLPALGKPVMVVNGPHAGAQATLLSINESNFSASVKLLTGPSQGEVVNNVEYEDISKIHQG